MISIQNKKDCCGCNACGDACAHNAISFQIDSEGFWYPEVDAEKCVDCGLCDKVCPIVNISSLKKNDLPQSVCYAAEHKNLEVVFDSTSGGLFSALAEETYRMKGYVGGAVYSQDYRSVYHFISYDRKDLVKLRSSKYLQSNVEGFYKKVKELVRSGEKVLVCGTPCQMAALRAFLGKDYDNLIIVDFICRGINSPQVWGKYLDSFEERYGSKVIWAKSKSKELGWRNLTQKVILEDGRHIYEPKDINNFAKGYLLTGAYCRPSCYECQFKGYPRMADITLADFWGVEKVEKSLDKDLGTSLVMLNSNKGKAFFELIQNRIKSVPVPFEQAEKGNPALTTPLPKPKVDRDRFFEDLASMSFVDLSAKYFPKSNVESFRTKMKKTLLFWKKVASKTRLRPKAVWQFFKYNSCSDIRKRNVLIPAPYCSLNIKNGAHIIKEGITIVGDKFRFPKSHLETRLYVGSGATLYLGPETIIGYGSDVEVFENACLKFAGHGGCNIGATIVCADRIEFGDGTIMGRNVTLRDNNGDHYINRPGYKNTNPIIVGDKVWLCEQCTILSGVKIGDGAIVGARSFVIRNVPAHSMVSGHPAEVIDEDVFWKL